MNIDIKYVLALIQLKGIGDATARKLMEYYGSAESVFDQISRPFERVKWSEKLIEAFQLEPDWESIEEELNFLSRSGVEALSILDEAYPRRLRFCSDAPVLIYVKGTVDLNHPKILAIVGTRRATSQGKEITRKIVEGLADQNVLIISGLAFGIDIVAHQAALQNNMPTIGVVAHGLDRIYPMEHIGVAHEMEKNGGMLTEFRKGVKPDRENFPKRNRIVAGMADAVLVIESQKKGGSMITADLGFGYGRDVFAIPGRPNDQQSEGCNYLIRNNKAALIESAQDIKYAMNWEDEVKPKSIQKQLFVELTPEEENLMGILKDQKKIGLNELCLSAGIPVSQASMSILTMELNGLIRTLPGKIIELV
ncbi:DNA-processing protein DprA [bacterium SCSIO 12643]|nr:DNA-processing protein DprA [bacterium SCSIO 12643]